MLASPLPNDQFFFRTSIKWSTRLGAAVEVIYGIDRQRPSGF